MRVSLVLCGNDQHKPRLERHRGLSFAFTMDEYSFLIAGDPERTFVADIDKDHIVTIMPNKFGRKLVAYTSPSSNRQYLYSFATTMHSLLNKWNIRVRSDVTVSMVLDMDHLPNNTMRARQPLPGQFFNPPVQAPEVLPPVAKSANAVVAEMQRHLSDEQIIDRVLQRIMPPVAVAQPNGNGKGPKTDRRVRQSYKFGKVAKLADDINRLAAEIGVRVFVDNEGKVHVEF